MKSQAFSLALRGPVVLLGRAASHMPRGRQTDEELLQWVEALFFERYTGPDCVAQGYKEVDNLLYAVPSAASSRCSGCTGFSDRAHSVQLHREISAADLLQVRAIIAFATKVLHAHPIA